MAERQADERLAPLFKTPLQGVEASEHQLALAYEQQRLPSAYLLIGTEGIGKATLALRLAGALLQAGGGEPEEASLLSPGMDLFGDTPTPSPEQRLPTLTNEAILSRMINGAHPDFLWISPPYDEKKKAYKPEIPIELIRSIGTFMARTAAEGRWKVVLIDPAEAMNNNAANALLKWLEEPPAGSLFMLISHRPGMLLPTIRSRCRMVSVSPPDWDGYQRIVSGTIPSEQAGLLYHLTGASPGLSFHWYEQGIHRYWSQMLEAVAVGDDAARMAAILSAAEAMAKDTQLSFSRMQRLSNHLLRCLLACVQGSGEQTALSPQECELCRAIASRRPVRHWLDVWEAQQQLYSEATRLYLDRKQLIIRSLWQLSGADTVPMQL